MKLVVTRRTVNKSITKQLRRAGQIPAIIYSRGNKGTEVAVDGVEFKKILNTTPTGTLSSKVLQLVDEQGTREVVVKEIQYNITTYTVIHIDFEETHQDQPITLNIPLVFTHMSDCVGFKLGGLVRPTLRYIPVTCLPKDIPQQFTINVQDMQIGQSKRVEALQVPPGVKLEIDPKEVAVVIARK
jgi:large subunit ribosomal protein L25